MSRPPQDSSGTTVYSARAVHTLDPARVTTATVTVRDGRFLTVGDPDDLPGTPLAALLKWLEPAGLRLVPKSCRGELAK